MHMRVFEMTKCVMCGESHPMSEDHRSPSNAMWEPFYGDMTADVDRDGPVCPECVTTRLVYLADEGYYFNADTLVYTIVI